MRRFSVLPRISNEAANPGESCREGSTTVSLVVEHVTIDWVIVSFLLQEVDDVAMFLEYGIQ